MTLLDQGIFIYLFNFLGFVSSVKTEKQQS